MKVRLLLLSILLISSPHLAAGLFDKIIQDVNTAVVKELDKSGVSVAPNDKQSASILNSVKTPPKKTSALPDCTGGPWNLKTGKPQTNCYGTYKTKDNSPDKKGLARYVGEFKEGKYNGQGTRFSSFGDKIYMGEWKDDKRRGQGTSFHQNGKRRIVGEWKEGLAQGQGTEFYEDYEEGTKVYVGEFKDSTWTGQGTTFSPDGTKNYTGTFKNYTKEGQGTQFNQDGSIMFSGEWKDGKKHDPVGELKELYEKYFLVRACNDLDTRYISNSQFKKTKKAIRSLDDQAKKQGVDTDKAYKEAEENPSEETNNTLAMVKTIKLMGGGAFQPQLRSACVMMSNGLILLAEGDKAKKQKGKKDF